MDIASSFFYVRARHLRSILARWLTVDPRWPRQRPYAYASNCPLSRIDPSGLQPGGGPCIDQKVYVNVVLLVCFEICDIYKCCKEYTALCKDELLALIGGIAAAICLLVPPVCALATLIAAAIIAAFVAIWFFCEKAGHGNVCVADCQLVCPSLLPPFFVITPQIPLCCEWIGFH